MGDSCRELDAGAEETGWRGGPASSGGDPPGGESSFALANALSPCAGGSVRAPALRRFLGRFSCMGAGFGCTGAGFETCMGAGFEGCAGASLRAFFSAGWMVIQ